MVKRIIDNLFITSLFQKVPVIFFTGKHSIIHVENDQGIAIVDFTILKKSESNFFIKEF